MNSVPTNLKLTIPATFVSHKRGQRITPPSYSILKIENCLTRKEAENFVGNSVVSVYSKDGEKFINRGRISKAHGNSGALLAKFKRNLPPKKFGSTVFINLYKINEDEI